MLPKMAKRFLRLVGRVIAVMAVTGAVGIAALLAWLWLDHSRSTTLPAPTGAYRVGRVTYDWVDDARVNPYAPVAGARQELAKGSIAASWPRMRYGRTAFIAP